MDFVVVGFGLGALGVLLGVVMLGWLARTGRARRGARTDPDDAACDLAVAAECRGDGQAFLYAGGAMLLATVGGLAGALDDRTGAFLVATTATVAALGILLGGYLHRVALSRRRRTRRIQRPLSVPAHPDGAAIADPTRTLPIASSRTTPTSCRMVRSTARELARTTRDLPRATRSRNAVSEDDRAPAAPAQRTASRGETPITEHPLASAPIAAETTDSWTLAGRRSRSRARERRRGICG